MLIYRKILRITVKAGFFLLLSSYFALAIAPHELSNTKLRIIDGLDLSNLITTKLGNLGMIVTPKLNPLRKFPLCSKNLKILPAFGSWKTAKIICSGKENWKTSVRTNLQEAEHEIIPLNEKKLSLGPVVSKEKLVKVVMLKTDLKSGQIISASDIELADTEKFVSQSYFTSATQVLGRKLKSSVKMGWILKDRHLVPNWAILKDQPIIIEAKNTSFSVYADGIALSNGYIGDVIKVRNTGSGHEFYAWVASKKKVNPLANINQD